MSDSASKDLIIKEISNSPLVKKEYKNMLANIRNTLPAIKQTSSNFYKSPLTVYGCDVRCYRNNTYSIC
jgi:hypothetical protein